MSETREAYLNIKVIEEDEHISVECDSEGYGDLHMFGIASFIAETCKEHNLNTFDLLLEILNLIDSGLEKAEEEK